MARLDAIRKNGAIPERRHDAFLLALLLAIVFNVAFFAAQALLPRLGALLQMLGAEPPAVQQEEFPFVLVDPSFLDEDPADIEPDATSTVNRAARQAESAPVDGDAVHKPEGIQEQLSLAEGNPGEVDPGVDSAGLPDIEQIGDDATVDAESTEQIPDAADASEPADAQETVPADDAPQPADTPDVSIEEIEPLPDPVQQPEPQPVPEPIPEPPPPELLPEPLPEPPPEPLQEPQPVTEQFEEPLPPPPQVEEVPEPSPVPEPAPEPFEPPPEPSPEPVVEPVPEPEPTPEPMSELIDLAMLPTRDQGIFDPRTQEAREYAHQPTTITAPVPEQFESRDYFQPEPQPPQLYRPQPPVPQQPNQPVRPTRRNREGTPQATFKQTGGASRAGGAPPRQNMRGRNVNLFDDPYMALLKDRYPEYMAKLLRMLQDSLNRTMVLYPSYYATGQSRILFTLSDQGKVVWYETQYPVDGSDNTLRAISERTLLDAGPFGPPPAAMLADPAFQRMSLTVFIY